MPEKNYAPPFTKVERKVLCTDIFPNCKIKSFVINPNVVFNSSLS
jgi:hypothetical protein